MSPTTTIDSQIRTAVEVLMSTYARTLDERRLEDWAELFSDDAAYRVVPRNNLERGLPLGIMTDTTKGRIRDRVLFVRKIWAGNYTDYVSRHLHTLMSVEPTDDGAIATVSNFAVYASEPDRPTLLLAVGEYRDLLVNEGEGLRFRERQVIIDSEISPRYLVYPL